MALIKIKFKESTSITTFEIGINFISNGTLYSKISGNGKMQLLYNDFVVNSDSSSWANPNYQYIEIDPTQTNFNSFITAMKSNIAGVLLESGTYIWNSEQPFSDGNFPTSAERKIVKFNFKSNNVDFSSCGVSVYGAGEFHFAYGKSTVTTTGNTYLNDDVSSGKVKEVCNTEAYDFWGSTDVYRTIILDTDQYVDYDFYSNYVGSKLNKQQPTPTSYTITDNLTNVSAAGSNVYQIDQGGTRSLTYSWSTQYVVGVNNINVVNADYTPTFNGNSVTLALSNPSGNVTINITASEGDFEFNITSNGTTTLATENTYVEHDIVFKVNVPATPTEKISVDLYMASGNQTINASSGKTLSQVVITKPSTFTSDNIKDGVDIGGVVGTYEGLIPDGTAVASNVRAGKTFYGNGTSKLTGTMQDYTGSTTIKSNGTMYTAGKYMPSNIVINVPNPTLSGNAIASQVLKGQKFYSNSYTILTGTMETYSGDTYLTKNGTYETNGKYMNSNIIVDMNAIVDVETSTEMDALLVEDNVSKYYKYTGTTDDKYTNGDIYQVQEG